MQIGSGSNHLPGCAPTAGGTPPAASPEPPPAPAFAPPAAAPGATPPVRPFDKKSSCLVAGVLLLVVLAAAAYFLVGREFKKAGGSDGAGVRQALGKLASFLPGRTTVAVSNGVPLTAAQQRMVAELSPARPIHEARRVSGLESARVAGGETNAAAVAVPVAATAAVPVAVAAPPPAAVPAPVATTPAGKVKPARGTGAASATPAEKPFVWPGVRITAAIGGQQAKWIALINGRLVSVGDSVDGVSVVAISAQRVTLAAGNGQQRDFYVGAGR
ncbi:MAG: hypothetical protein WCI17_11705 [bacterium]